MDEKVEELKRLCAFTGLKIIKVVVNDDSLEFALRAKGKIFRLVFKDGTATLFDELCNEIIRLCPKISPQPCWPVTIQQPQFPSPTVWYGTSAGDSTAGNITITSNSSLANLSWEELNELRNKVMG